MFTVPRHISDSSQKCQISVSHFTPKLQLAMGDSSIHKHIVYRIMIGPSYMSMDVVIAKWGVTYLTHSSNKDTVLG